MCDHDLTSCSQWMKMADNTTSLSSENGQLRVELTFDKLDTAEIEGWARDAACGAVVAFVGTTRDNFKGKKVVNLEYESYQSMALKEMRKLGEKVIEKYSLKKLAIVHRLGCVPVLEASVIIVASSPHRKEAIYAIDMTIDELKRLVPIWKKEVYEDGSQWKGPCCHSS